MKPILLLALGLLWSSKARAQTNNLEAQRTALTQVGQAVSRVVVKAKKVNEQLGYGFAEGGCVFGVRLRPGSGSSESISLQAGQSYVFIGGGDKTARNVDIVLRDANGRVVSQDTEADAAPFLLFQPKKTRRYTFSLSLKSGWKGSAFCALTILRKGGINVPLERLVQAAIRMDYATYETLRQTQGGRFNESPGTWSLYGAVLRQSQSFSPNPKCHSTTYRGLVAVSDGNIRHLDLALLDGSKKTVAQAAKQGATPKIIQKVNAGSYTVRVSNHSSSGPALVMAVLLDLPNQPQTQPTPVIAATPTPTLPGQADQILSFEGDWKGEWTDAHKGREGNLKMRVKRDGAVNGQLTIPSLRVSAKFKGRIDSYGQFQWNYSQFKQDSTAEGTLKFSDERQQKANAQVKFSTDDTVFGSAELLMEKQH